MASSSGDEVYDLLILVDSTYSMINYLEALQISLPKVIAISNLTNSFSRIGLLAYRDYSEINRSKDSMLEWSGWYGGKVNGRKGHGRATAVTAQMLSSMASHLEPIGGGDYPEALKTGLARAYQLMRDDATTIILLYTDAPPHCWMVADKGRGSNYHEEQTALRHSASYGGFGHKFADWVSACQILHEGDKKAHVFCFLDEELGSRPLNSGYYTYLSTVTRGACFTLTDSSPRSIAQITVDVLLAWMGVGKKGVEDFAMAAKLVRYKSGKHIKHITNEQDALANSYFWAARVKRKGINMFMNPKVFEAQQHQEQVLRLDNNIAKVSVTYSVLEKHLPKRRPPVMDFAKRYSGDPVFKALVVEQLGIILETDVTSMSLNPVFGVLWRAVCNDRDNPARDKLITAFGLQIEKIKDANEKTRMKNWLEESYDYASEILDTLDNVPEHQRFPCVFLDPTINFALATTKDEQRNNDGEDEDNRPLSAFRRDELLEIGRSCDGRILRRLGKVLTRITYVESSATLPAHIAAASNQEVPRIPTALASQEFGRSFWRILLHVVLPGTMLSARPAAILAALAIKIGLRPLFSTAAALMLFWRDKWNNLEVPETWNSSCLGLLLDADAEYKKQIRLGEDLASNKGLLFETDRELFESLVTYHHTGTNLLTTLTAEVGWTPQKTHTATGTIVVCRGCKFPRSITIMAEGSGGKCGLCVKPSWDSVDHRDRALSTNVSIRDTASTKIAWVECSIQTCRAQYVCYNTADLNVRPKCWYCRIQTSLLPTKRCKDPAPTLECAKCLSKIIWPREWRYMVQRPFHCTACLNGTRTIVSLDTTAEQICKENGQHWLIQNKNNVLVEPFKRSLFKTVTTVGIESFRDNVRVFPVLEQDTKLTIHGKRIRNVRALTTSLQNWTLRRTTERTHCSLCFNTFVKSRLLPACRRRGCHQSICEGCLNSWYGLNSCGTVINTAALFCPFCRRPPAARTLAAYGKGIHAVSNLKVAYEERGSWVHAWCYECNRAQRLMERECAAGAPDTLQQWRCGGCDDAAIARARLAVELARRELQRIDLLDGVRCRAAEEDLRVAEAAQNRLQYPVKECPTCRVPTQKTYGCDHMTCPCGTHWCWACGDKGSSASGIYSHLRTVHGGLYAGGEGLGYDSEDEYR